MNTQTLNFDIYAMVMPKNRQDCIALANEILAELEMIEAHIDAAIARLGALGEGRAVHVDNYA